MAVNVLTGTGNVTKASANSGTTLTISKPANTANGDVLLAVIYARESTVPYTTPPAGWTHVPGPTGVTTGLVVVYWKRIPTASAETATSYNWAGGGGSGRHAGMIMRVTGTHPTNPINASGTTYVTSVTASPQLTLPGINVTAGGTLLVLAGVNNPTATVASSAGFTAVDNSITTTGGNESQLLVLKRDYTTTVTSDNVPVVITPPAGSGIGHLLALRSPNQPPVVDAGPDKIGAIGQETTFTATVTDPDSPIATRQWTQLSGPENLTITNGTSNAMKVTPNVGGVYVFEMKATDDVGAEGSALVSLVVPAPDGRPYSVTSNPGSWEPTGSKPTIPMALADELDQTYAQTPEAPNGAAITLKISPVTNGNITLVTRGRQSTTTPQISRKVELLQGTTTVIASHTFNLTSAYADYALVLTTAQNAAVTDRANLHVRITDTQLP